MTINIIKYKKVWLGLSTAITAVALGLTLTLGLNFGIDFTGGSILELKVPNSNTQTITTAVESVGLTSVVQQSTGDLYLVRLGVIDEAQHQTLLSAIKSTSPEAIETQFTSVGPTVGAELKKAAISAILVLLIAIGLYIVWAFRKVSRPVASWKYGLVTMAAAFHDVVVPMGVFAILGKVFGYQIDTAFVAALLTILGYSINDTIVVLDRTRENLLRHRFQGASFGEVVNASINETFGRSINTTLTTLLPLIAILVVGGESTRPFILALTIGIVSGAYSSIFLASPLLVAIGPKK